MVDLHSVVPPHILSALGNAELRVLVFLLLHANQLGRVAASVPEISAGAGASPRTVRRALRRLEGRSILYTTSRPGKPTLYELNPGHPCPPQNDTPRSPVTAPGGHRWPGSGAQSVVVSVQTVQESRTIAEQTRKWGVGQSTVDQWLAEYGPERVTDALEVVRRTRRARNPGGLLRRAVERGWRVRKTKKPPLMVLAKCVTCGSSTTVRDPEVHEGVLRGLVCREYTRGGGGGAQDLWGVCGGELVVEQPV